MNTSNSRISVFPFLTFIGEVWAKGMMVITFKKVPTSQLFIQTHTTNINANTFCGFAGRDGILHLCFCQHWKPEIMQRGCLKLRAVPACAAWLFCMFQFLLVSQKPAVYQRAEPISHLSSAKASFSILQMSGHKYETCLMLSGQLCCVSSSVQHCLDW